MNCYTKITKYERGENAMKFIKGIVKLFIIVNVVTFIIAVIGGIIDESGSSSSNSFSNKDYTEDHYSTDTYVSDDTEYDDSYDFYVEETESYTDPYNADSTSVSGVPGEGYLGGFTTADGTSDIYFYEADGQRYYYGTIYGVYYEGIVEVYQSHSAIYCLDGSKNDGTIAAAFYMGYNENNEMSPYELYEQTYGTGFYWHHH